MENDLKIIIPPAIQAQMDANPKLGEAMREIFAAMRQAHHAVQSGQYATFDDAMEAITGCRPEPVDLDDDFPPEAA